MGQATGALETGLWRKDKGKEDEKAREEEREGKGERGGKEDVEGGRRGRNRMRAEKKTKGWRNRRERTGRVGRGSLLLTTEQHHT